MPSRRAVLPALAVAVLFALPLLPEILGARRLIFRDAQITHWPWRRVAMQSLAAGRVPFVNVHASGGQPLLANPNAVLLYPTLLLEHVVEPNAAFNLHYLVHVLWAFLGARRLARALGLGEDAAFLAAVAYAFSGMFLSYASAFMNSAAAAAWLPWCAAAFLALARAPGWCEAVRASAAAGLAFGLQLLAGEPAISLLTAAFSGILAALVAAAGPRERRGRALATLAAGAAAAAALAAALAAPLLLPLRAVFPLTYRGQHLFSKQAFGAAAFTPERAIEWLLPRFGGDPGTLGGGANWLSSVAGRELVYIWCVTIGVVPLVLLAAAALRREFWTRRTAALAAGGLACLLLAFGFALPFYRVVYAVTFLRKLRYPIKFYLLTTLCAALLAGAAVEALRRRRAPGRDGAAVAALLAAWAAAFWAAAPGGALDRWAAPLAAQISDSTPAFLAAFRGAVRSDALVGALAALVAALILRRRASMREPGWALGLAAMLSALVWGLPLFVAARGSELARPPALLARVRSAGRVYVSPKLPRFDMATLPIEAPGALPRTEKTARVLVEELVPLTAAEFGARYLFENDPDGSYGFYNRIASEAADASTPAERDRLLRVFGARWALADEGEEHPLMRPVTGFAVAGRRLVLFETPEPMPEMRWAGRAWRRASLSGTLELVRSERFRPETDVALPGSRDADPDGKAASAAVAGAVAAPDRAQADVDAAGPGFLLFSRTFFPSWSATVDGAPVRIGVANARELAIPVPAGRHRVEVAWDRRPFRTGVAVQAAAFAIALAAAIAARPAARRGNILATANTSAPAAPRA